MLIAYVDPGLGMLIWQTIVAAFVGAIFYMNKTRRWIAATIRNLFGRGEKTPGPGDKIHPNFRTLATHVDEHGPKPRIGAAETEGRIDAR
jgi:hypothetical protein